MDKYIYNENNGIITVDTSTLKEEIQEEYKQALGEDLSLEDATPQGRLIDIETTTRSNILNNNANLVNSFNLNLSFGSMLDNLASNFNAFRRQTTQSRVLLTLTGQPDTVIIANSKVSSESGKLYYLEEEATIGENGTVDAIFSSVEYGEINDPINTINQIIDSVVGWETVNNPVAFEYIGNELESDASFKRKIKQGALFNGKGLLQDYRSALYKVDNVEKVFVRDNGDNEDKIYKGVLIKKNSIYCCVYGGNDEEIAKAIFNCKSSGCGYTGSTVVQVQDKDGIYNVKFQRPTLKDIYCQITIKIIDNSSNNIEEAIKQTIIDYSNGNLSDYNELNIGDDVNCFDLASVVGSNVNGIIIQNFKIGLDNESLSNNDITINANELSNFLTENIEVVVNE